MAGEARGRKRAGTVPDTWAKASFTPVFDVLVPLIRAGILTRLQADLYGAFYRRAGKPTSISELARLRRCTRGAVRKALEMFTTWEWIEAKHSGHALKPLLLRITCSPKAARDRLEGRHDKAHAWGGVQSPMVDLNPGRSDPSKEHVLGEHVTSKGTGGVSSIPRASGASGTMPPKRAAGPSPSFQENDLRDIRQSIRHLNTILPEGHHVTLPAILDALAAKDDGAGGLDVTAGEITYAVEAARDVKARQHPKRERRNGADLVASIILNQRWQASAGRPVPPLADVADAVL